MTGGPSQFTRSALPLLSPRLYTAGVAFEAVLGAWLVLGIAPMWSWLSSIGFFTLLAALSSRLAMLGQASCGCAGRLPLHPWWAFAIDTAALAALILFRPRWADFRRDIRDSFPTALRMIGISAALLAVFIAVAILGFGSIDRAFATLRGETFTLTPVLDLGTHKAGSAVEGAAEATNFGDKPILIYGATNNCSCIGNLDLPVIVEPGQRQTVRFKIRLPYRSGWFSRKIEFDTDCEVARKVRCTIVGVSDK